MTAETIRYSFGEVGHDPPIHVVAGQWQGPSVVSRASARNQSLCGKPLSRVKKRQPETHELCRICEDLMKAYPQASPPPGQAQLPAAPLSTEARDYEIRVVTLGELFVDQTPGLQRPEQESWSGKIGRQFSWARFNENPPKVSARPGGRYHVMDGQHEVAGARAAGHGPETQVRVHVWRGLSYQQEAEMFSHNRDRHAVRALDLFMADVTSGRPEAVALDVLLNSYGWAAGSAGREGNFAAVTTMTHLYVKAGGPEICEKVIDTITRAWDHNPDAANRTVITALGAFYQKYPAAETSRLALVLHRMGKPSVMHSWTHEEKDWKKVAVLRLQQHYDSGLRDRQRRLESPSD